MIIRYPNGNWLNTYYIKRIRKDMNYKVHPITKKPVLTPKQSITIEFISHESRSMDTEELDLETMEILMCRKLKDVDEFLDWLYAQINGEK